MVPVIEALAQRVSIPISIDTSKPEVMHAAVAAGAGMVNDVYGLRREGALDAAAELGVPVVLMHMQGRTAHDAGQPRIRRRGRRGPPLPSRAHLRRGNGRHPEKNASSSTPASASAKNARHNLQLLAQLRRFTELGVPVLAGLSRKRTIGELTGRDDPRERVFGSVAAHLIAAQNGAMLLRVHDVAATVDALKVWNAVAAAPMPRVDAKPAIRWPDED